MADYTWPSAIVPFQQSFYLQPHTGGSESPFSRVTKVYGLSAPRWVCTMSLRGGYWGTRGLEAVGPEIDAFLAKIGGRENRVLIGDFRRPKMRSSVWPSNAGNTAAAIGATAMTITGLPPGTPVYAGDYIGGDGRPHIVLDTVYANSSGQAAIVFKPPLKAAIALNSAIFGNPTGIFRLTDDDAANNGVSVGEAAEMTLSFVEDL